jgi:hypothetical protein
MHACPAASSHVAGKQVAVLEARTRGSGQSGKSSGMLMQWNNDFYANLAALLGREGAGHVGQAHKAAVDWLERVVEAEGIRCAFERTHGLLLAHDGSAAAGRLLDGPRAPGMP